MAVLTTRFDISTNVICNPLSRTIDKFPVFHSETLSAFGFWGSVDWKPNPRSLERGDYRISFFSPSHTAVGE